MKKIILIVAVILSVFVTLAMADDDIMPSRYVALKGGAFSPNNDLGTTNTGLKNFESGINAELLFGKRVNGYFAYETGIGYYTTNAKTGYDSKLNVFDITISGMGILPVGNIDILAGAGIGVVYATFSGASAETGTSRNYEYKLFGGVDFNVTKNISIGAEYKYSVAKVGYIKTSGSKINVDVGGSTYNGVIKYKF